MTEVTNTTNLLEEFKGYIERLDSKKVANIKSALYRYYGAGLSGHKTKKTRFDERAINKAEKLLSKVIVDENFKIEDHLGVFERGREILGVEATKARASKSYLRTFLDYVNNKFNKRSLEVMIKEEKKKRFLYRRKVVDKSYINDILTTKKRKEKEILVLVKNPEFYLNRLEDKYKNKCKLELEKIAEENIKRLYEEEQNYIDYWKNEGVREITIDNHLKHIKRLLGWEYRYENREMTIEDLSLMKLIPVINTKVYNVKEREKRYIREGELQDEAREQSKYLLKKIERFFKGYKVTTVSSAKNYISGLISLAKLAYKDITDMDEADNYEDIVLIRFLRVKKRKLNDVMASTERKPLPLTWEEVLEVVESYRIDVTKKGYEVEEKIVNKAGEKRSNIVSCTKSMSVKAQHLQRFLILSLFTIIPPDRQRTIRELTYGGTLKYGKEDNTGYLIPLEPDKDINNEGNYFIDLKAEDYKTGATYGDFRIAIPNKKYEDGSTFYSYLNKWLFEGYRDKLAKEGVKTVFVGAQLGNSMTVGAMGSYVKSKFLARTGVELSPHKLRNIFITHINNEGLTDTERKSIAYAMKHDLTTAEKVYNNQTSKERLKPAMDYIKNSQSKV